MIASVIDMYDSGAFTWWCVRHSLVCRYHTYLYRTYCTQALDVGTYDMYHSAREHGAASCQNSSHHFQRYIFSTALAPNVGLIKYDIHHQCPCTSTCLHPTFHQCNLKHLSSRSRCSPSQAMSGNRKSPRKAAARATVAPNETAEIAVAASAASTSPPPDAGSKPSTPVDQTHKKRTKGKNSRRHARHLVYTLLFITAT